MLLLSGKSGVDLSDAELQKFTAKICQQQEQIDFL
jgi:hypothetical protein